MNYLFTICGRAGSKGLKSKNISNFDGIPLVYYTIGVMGQVMEILTSQGHCVKAALSTDSEALADLVLAQDTVPFFLIERSEELSGDRVAKVSVIKDALIRSEDFFELQFNYVIDLDITAPLRTVDDVLMAIRKKQSRQDTDYVYSLCPSRKNPYFNMAKKVEKADGSFYEKVIKANFVSRQELPPIYDMNASIYVYEVQALMNKEPSGFFNDGADAIIMKDTGILDIDCADDKEMMEVLAKNYFFERDEDFREMKELAEKVLVSTSSDTSPSGLSASPADNRATADNFPEGMSGEDIEDAAEINDAMCEAFINLYESFKILTETHYNSLSKSPLCSMPLTALIFADCIKTDIQAVLDLKEQNVPDRYVEGIIRGICEQVIEFIYLYRNQSNNPSLLLEYYGLNRTEAELADLENEPNLFKRVRMLIGDKRYSAGRNIHSMSLAIGEDVGTDDEMSLYEAYQLTSTLYHNSYRESFMELVGTVSKLLQKAEKNAGATTASLSSSSVVDAEAGRSGITVEAADEDDEGDVDDSDLDFIMLITILTRFMETYQKIVDEIKTEENTETTEVQN